MQPQSAKPSLDPHFIFESMLRGFKRHCPKCGEGLLFDGYIKPRPACAHCGEGMGQIFTADIAPYFTILIVGHLVVLPMLMAEQLFHPAMWLQVAIWPAAALFLTLWFLPRVKGCIMALMWVLDLRGNERQ